MSLGVLSGWAAFIGTHLYMSDPANRAGLVRLAGDEKKFVAAYSAVSLGIFIPTTWYWTKNRNSGMRISNLRSIPGVLLLSDLLTVASMMTFAGVIATPSPIKPAGAADRSDASEPRGMNRITRHPTFWAFSAFAIARALSAVALVDLIYWTGYPLLTIVGGAHQDARKRATMPKEFFEKAILEGRQSFKKVLEEVPAENLAIGALIGAGLVAVRRKGARAASQKPSAAK